MRSVAVIIFNDESNETKNLQTITNTFYRLNMTVAVLENKTAEEIQEAVIELTEMDPDEILDIIFVIHAKQFKHWDRKFSTVDGKILDLYNNIIYYLLEVEYFKDKPKIIIFKVSGRDDTDDLEPYNPEKEFKCKDYGSNSEIIWAHSDKFIAEFFREIGEHRNLSKAIQNKSELIEKHERSIAGVLKLKVPPSNDELTSEFHEFVQG